MKKANPNRNKGVAFSNGFYLGVFNAIKEKQNKEKEFYDNSKALVLKTNENNELAKELYYSQFNNIVSKKSNSSAKYYKESYDKGREYGKDLEIEKGLKGGSEQLLLF